MNSPEWRSFVSLEMVELESDFDLETRSIHDDSTNQLLQPACYATSVNKEPPASLRSCQSSIHNRSQYLEGTTTLHQRCQDTNRDPKQLQTDSTQAVMDPPPHVYWKRNPLCHLTWESLGLVTSICFFGTLFRRS
jgi:hypothetical protein